MSGSAIKSVQRAIYDAMRNDSALSALVGGRIYQNVPDATAYPYVAIGDWTEVPQNTMGLHGYNMTVTMHSWSKANSLVSALDINTRLTQVLDDAVLTATGFEWVDCSIEFTQPIEEMIGTDKAQQVVARFRVQVTE